MDLEPATAPQPNPLDDGDGRPRIDVSADGAGIRFEVRGRLDAATAHLLGALLESAEQADADVVAVDVRHVTDFTERGVTSLARSLASSGGRRPKVRYRAGSRAATQLLVAAAGAGGLQADAMI